MGEDKEQYEMDRTKIEMHRIDVEREKIRYLYDLGKQAIETFKNYYLKKVTRIVVPAYVTIVIVAIIAGYLTYIGRISGETFAFLAGSIVGYIISVLSKHL